MCTCVASQHSHFTGLMFRVYTMTPLPPFVLSSFVHQTVVFHFDPFMLSKDLKKAPKCASVLRVCAKEADERISHQCKVSYGKWHSAQYGPVMEMVLMQ